MKIVRLFFGAVALAALVGCSTPATRINRNPEVFSKLTAQDQQLIRDGHIAIGFTQEMVRLALGDPDRIYTRSDSNGTSESWSYTAYEMADAMIMPYRGFYRRNWAVPYYPNQPYYPYSLDGGYQREREYFKVVFTGGRVSAIEQRS